jgi:Lrp/AsnC family leucine-responsive transcriptional regulator
MGAFAVARPKGHVLDPTDLELVRELESGHIDYETLHAKVGLSKASCRRRVKQLIDSGYIAVKGVVLPSKAKWQITEFVMVKLPRNDEEAIETFGRHVLSLRNVLSCHQISGPYDFLLRVATSNMDQTESVRRALAGIITGSSTETLHIIKSFKTYNLPPEALFESPRVGASG